MTDPGYGALQPGSPHPSDKDGGGDGGRDGGRKGWREEGFTMSHSRQAVK